MRFSATWMSVSSYMSAAWSGKASDKEELMKHEMGIAQPEYLVEDWPGKYEVFSWLEYVVTVPNPIFLVTTRKANGAPSVLSTWSAV